MNEALAWSALNRLLYGGVMRVERREADGGGESLLKEAEVGRPHYGFNLHIS